MFAKLQQSVFTIITDAEPDDLVALMLLQKQGHLANANVVVSGWQADGLRQKAEHVRQLFGLDANRVFLGEPSWVRFSYPVIEGRSFAPWHSGLFQDAFVLCLAPPKELLTVQKQAKQRFNSNLALYGSFNLRSLLKAPEPVSATELLELLDAFDQVILYEDHFATGGKGAVHDPVLLDLISKSPIGTYIPLWNQHIVQDCQRSLPKSSDAERHRKQKIIDSIEACPLQFLNADSGLVAALLRDPKLETCRLEFDNNGYTQATPASTHISVVRGDASSHSDTVAWLIEILQ